MIITKKIIAFTLLTTSVYLYAMPVSLSVSTNGKYAISADGNNHAYLYNLDKHTVKDLGGDYNYNSAYFVPNSDNYLLQKKDTNEVAITNVSGKIIYKFNPKLQANSNAISTDLKHYVTSDAKFNIYLYKPQETVRKQILKNLCMGDEKGSYKGLTECSYGHADFNFIESDKLLFTTSGYLYDYNISRNKWNARPTVGGPDAMNAISPDGKFVYTADSGLSGIKYNLDDGKVSNSALYYPDDNLENISYIPYTKDRKTYLYNGLTNFKFIDKNKIIVTFKGKNQPYLWAFTFDTDNLDWSNNTKWKRPVFFSKNYLPLVKDPLKYITGDYRNNTDPRPNVSGYNTTFDTSVEAHKLVIAGGDGIMVYNYNPSDESLKLDWVGVS